MGPDGKRGGVVVKRASSSRSHRSLWTWAMRRRKRNKQCGIQQETLPGATLGAVVPPFLMLGGIRLGGSDWGISLPPNFPLIKCNATANPSRVSFPSPFISARSLQSQPTVTSRCKGLTGIVSRRTISGPANHQEV